MIGHSDRGLILSEHAQVTGIFVCTRDGGKGGGNAKGKRSKLYGNATRCTDNVLPFIIGGDTVKWLLYLTIYRSKLYCKMTALVE